ncbi:methanogen output domain 1-containing protein [Roseivivax isoporae]|uniref:Transcriptional regulator n=1 Tax=Roseivivax isoporae LMG 25204 TaxID=1449351 RepID=X7F6B2_9RHOB|nr:methanogen output domain 1-containing protein [Roseivivax isoporae]ETX28350.1 transcriptional regulator [Roseivivax isoporae LMG 25204]
MGHATNVFETAPIRRDRDVFLRELLRELAALLEDGVGLDQTAGYISQVGNRIGLQMNADYTRAAGGGRLDRDQVAAALVDLKRRIEGGFSVESIDDEKIVLVNTACPFGRYVEGRRSLCMMTSSVFGRVTAENLGYARVYLDKTIAKGAPGCRVEVWLTEGDDGIEYQAGEAGAAT